jgi:hypothetical protein
MRDVVSDLRRALRADVLSVMKTEHYFRAAAHHRHSWTITVYIQRGDNENDYSMTGFGEITDLDITQAITEASRGI